MTAQIGGRLLGNSNSFAVKRAFGLCVARGQKEAETFIRELEPELCLVVGFPGRHCIWFPEAWLGYTIRCCPTRGARP